MDTGELRKQILRALDSARRDAAERRQAKGQVVEAYERLLDTVAAPLVKQAVTVLRAEGQMFSAETPKGTVRLVRDGVPLTFLEFGLETTGREPELVGRVSLSRGRDRSVEDRPVAPGKPVAEVTEQDVSQFLVETIPALVLAG